MSAPAGYPVEGAGCDCVWLGNGVLASACEAHNAWRKADRERCAKLATLDQWGDCEDLGMMDPETGSRECARSTRGRDCICELKMEHGEDIAALIRKLA